MSLDRWPYYFSILGGTALAAFVTPWGLSMVGFGLLSLVAFEYKAHKAEDVLTALTLARKDAEHVEVQLNFDRAARASMHEAEKEMGKDLKRGLDDLHKRLSAIENDLAVERSEQTLGVRMR